MEVGGTLRWVIVTVTKGLKTEDSGVGTTETNYSAKMPRAEG